MTDMFSNTIPTIKSLSTHPLIVMEEMVEVKDIYWLWLLPSGQAITYGEKGQNRFRFYPDFKTPFTAANFDISEFIEIEAQDNSADLSDKIAHLAVKRMLYKTKDNVTIEDAAIVVTPAKANPKELSRLYCRETMCKEI
ncbi:MAG: hypothetical protein IKW39_05415 [Alphaproteobacteria bacterium]|nr:hypothetical protein [Alphaproteobacteria bacterium]